MRLLVIACLVSFVGNIASRFQDRTLVLVDVVVAAIASLVFFAPLLILAGALPVVIFNHIVASRAPHRDRTWRMGLSVLVFGTAAIAVVVLLIIDGKTIGSSHALFVAATIALAAIFGLTSESPVDQSEPR